MSATWRLLAGHAIDQLATLPDRSVQTIVTPLLNVPARRDVVAREAT